jgi:hypothetical protein
MHGRWRRLGRDWLNVARRERRGWLRPEPLGPGLGADAPGRRTWPTFHRPRPVAPDMDDLDHSALANPGTASPWCAEDVTLFSVRGLGPLPLSRGKTRSASDMNFHDCECQSPAPVRCDTRHSGHPPQGLGLEQRQPKRQRCPLARVRLCRPGCNGTIYIWGVRSVWSSPAGSCSRGERAGMTVGDAPWASG